MKYTALITSLVVVATGSAIGQSLPNPTRTAFKCEVNGKVQYSDQPCVGAKRVDLEPTRGMNKSSGTELVGKDVQRERFQEGFAEAVRPITGLDAEQFKVQSRRYKLSPESKRECASLDRSIPMQERTQVASSETARRSSDQVLFQLRSRFVKLGC